MEVLATLGVMTTILVLFTRHYRSRIEFLRSYLAEEQDKKRQLENQLRDANSLIKVMEHALAERDAQLCVLKSIRNI